MNKFAILRSPRILAPVAAAAGSVVATSAQAQTTIDVSDVVSTITSGITTITTLGIAVLSLVVVVKLFKWVKGAM
ncbi:major capsid protein [Comamonas aquatica]|uniref:major capsid protein n=1 Tax=Comamonas aquatica TaxID=225991 RepID=UPI0024483C93|nr:major capsid protein [Comamonas aquatica]MDH1903715.1 major capsid protein [Comamonas aquatica]